MTTVVKIMLMETFEIGDKASTKVGQLLCYLVRQNVLLRSQLTESIEQTASEAVEFDMATDVPKIWDYMGHIMGKTLQSPDPFLNNVNDILFLLQHPSSSRRLIH